MVGDRKRSLSPAGLLAVPRQGRSSQNLRAQGRGEPGTPGEAPQERRGPGRPKCLGVEKQEMVEGKGRNIAWRFDLSGGG